MNNDYFETDKLDVIIDKPIASIKHASEFIIHNIEQAVNCFFEENREEINVFLNNLVKYREKTYSLKGVNRIHWSAKGRSNSALKTFVIRLEQMGYECNDMSSDASKPVKKGEIGVIVSGSGLTESCVSHASHILKYDCTKVFGITSFPRNFKTGIETDYFSKNSGGLIENVEERLILMEMPGRVIDENFKRNYDERKLEEAYRKLTPMRTIFEDSVVIAFDSLVPYIQTSLGISDKTLKKGHSNIGQYAETK
jgi:D-arabinose 5-phosphate isomerase GutQ